MCNNSYSMRAKEYMNKINYVMGNRPIHYYHKQLQIYMWDINVMEQSINQLYSCII